MALPDLTGLTPIREFSQKTLAAAYPGGQAGVDDKTLLANINKRLYGTGVSPGIYSKFAGMGITPVSVGENKLEIPPELNYSTTRAITDAEQDLLNQQQNRQIAAMNAARATEQADIDRIIREAGLSGEFGVDPLTGQPKPTLAARELTQRGEQFGQELGFRREQLGQQESQFGRQIGSTERVAQLNRELQVELQKGDLGSREKIATLQATVQREQLALQSRIADLEMQLRRELQTQSEAARRGDLAAELASRERIAQLQAELTKSQQALQQGIALGSIGGTPTLENVQGGRRLDIYQSALDTANRQAQNKMYSDLIGSLLTRTRLLDTGVGAGGVGAIDRLLQGTIGKVGNAAVDAILRSIGGSTAAGGLGPLSSAEWTNLVGDLSPINDISDLLAGGFNPAPAPVAGTGAEAGATALGPPGFPPPLPVGEALNFGPGFPSINPATGLPAADLPAFAAEGLGPGGESFSNFLANFNPSPLTPAVAGPIIPALEGALPAASLLGPGASASFAPLASLGAFASQVLGPLALLGGGIYSVATGGRSEAQAPYAAKVWNQIYQQHGGQEGMASLIRSGQAPPEVISVWNTFREMGPGGAYGPGANAESPEAPGYYGFHAPPEWRHGAYPDVDAMVNQIVSTWNPGGNIRLGADEVSRQGWDR